MGLCRGGNSPENNAGEEQYFGYNCKDRCDNNNACTGYSLDGEHGRLCATYTSVGATGHGNSIFTCFMKVPGTYAT